MKEPVYRKIISAAVLAVALVLLAVGARTVYEVNPSPDTKPVTTTVIESGPGGPSLEPPLVLSLPPEAQPVSDLQLVENATFTGVTRKADGLYFTYDPSQKRGKQSCPT